MYNQPGMLNPKFLSCMADTAKIVMCFDEGLGQSTVKIYVLYDDDDGVCDSV